MYLPPNPVHRIQKYWPGQKQRTLSPAARRWSDNRLERFDTLQPDLFVPSSKTPASRRFVVIGDPGSGSRNQYKIARQMERMYVDRPFDSVLVLGDNVYEHGEPELFQDRIYAPYQSLFREGVKFFPVLGNHDVRKGFEDEQLKYWGAPRYYNFRKGEVEFFAIDTTLYLPGFDGTYKNNRAYIEQLARNQTHWLEAALSASDAKTKVVIGHYPLYSSGFHGVAEKYHLKLKNQLEPILTGNGVDLYLSGHDHHYERTPEIGGVTHIVSGAAGKLLKLTSPVAPHPRDKLVARYHFMMFEVQSDGGLKFEVIGKNGKLLDQGHIAPGDGREHKAPAVARFA